MKRAGDAIARKSEVTTAHLRHSFRQMIHRSSNVKSQAAAAVQRKKYENTRQTKIRAAAMDQAQWFIKARQIQSIRSRKSEKGKAGI
jgi:hypothetical protein